LGVEGYVSAIDLEYASQVKHRLMNAERLLAEFRRLRPGARLLDVGCSCGFLLKVARDKFGFEVYGVEPSTWAVDYALNNFGLQVRQGYIEESDFQKDSFDAIVMADVIEHLEDPTRSLLHIYEILKPAGHLLILTPDIGSLMARLAGRYWWGLLDEHNFYFSRKTLNVLLERCGFEVILCRSFGRAFLLSDWILKLSQYSTFLYRLSRVVTRILEIEACPVYLNLGDQMLCLCIKKG